MEDRFRKNGKWKNVHIGVLILSIVLMLMSPVQVMASETALTENSTAENPAAENLIAETEEAATAVSEETLDQTGRKIVHAGFFAWDGYHVQDADGVKSGYGYDFLKMTENYCNWRIKLVGYSLTWSDMLMMLDAGKIDLLTSAQKTAEWEEKYDYSDLPIGTSATVLSVRKEETQYIIGDTATYDGMTIGCLAGSSRNDKFDQFAKQNNFSYTYVYFNTLAELQQALADKSVDGVLSTNLRTFKGETVLEEFDPVDYYVIVKKGNTEILDQVNHAISKINLNTPSWKDELQAKYFSDPEEQEFIFNKEELVFLQQLKSQEKVFKVVTNPDLAPYSSYDKDGNPVGIAPDLFKELAARIGLSYEFVSFKTYEEYNTYVRTGRADIDLTCFHDYGLAEDNHITVSNPYMTTSLAMLSKDTFNGTVGKVAQVDASRHNTIYSDDLYDNVDVVTFATNEACVDAVSSGTADVAYLYTYAAQQAVEQDVKNRLMYTILPQYEIELCMGVNTDHDYRLIAIINEGIRCLEGNYTQQLIQREITHISEKDSLISLIYDYPLYAVVIGGIILVIVMIIIYVMFKRKQTEELLQKESEVSSARTEFFMMISHELRTPLNAVVSYLNMIQEDYVRNKSDMSYINRAQMAAHQLTEIAESMLDYTRISSGTVTLKNDIFKIQDVILQIDHLVALKASDKKQHYTFKTGHLVRQYLKGDSLRISLVFQNIMENAVKFTPEGGIVAVTLTEEVLDDERVKLVFTCKDTGKGMSEAFVKQIDSAFHQSDPSYSRTHGGLGLGLFLTQYFIKIMGGTFEVQSEEGKGSSVRITVPITCPSIEELVANNIKCQPVRTIIYEADEEEAGQTKTSMKTFGIKVDVMDDAKKLIKKIKTRVGGQYAYNVCILDVDQLEPVSEVAELVDAITSIDGTPTIYALTADQVRREAYEKTGLFRHVILKQYKYFELFNAYVADYGEYQPVDKSLMHVDYKGVHVMVVEDNQINAEILKSILEKANVDVTICENGKIAVEQFEAAPEDTYQMIFMDIQMPVMDGHEAARMIRHSNKPQAADIPIVAVSANAFPDDVKASLASGMNAHIAKPVDTELLFKEIETRVKRGDIYG